MLCYIDSLRLSGLTPQNYAHRMFQTDLRLGVVTSRARCGNVDHLTGCILAVLSRGRDYAKFMKAQQELLPRARVNHSINL